MTTRDVRRISMLSLGAAALLLLPAGAALAQATATQAGRASAPPAASKKDGAPVQATIIFRDGRTVTGTILSETATSVKFKGTVANIPFETEYQRADILSIQKLDTPVAGDAAPAGGKAPGTTPGATSTGSATSADAPPGDAAAPKVYFLDLKGSFGEDISQTPIRQAMRDAREKGADYVIVTLENDWNMEGGWGPLPNDAGAFDQIFRANDMEDVFNGELKRDWATPPKLVFWVKQAMGGASILPFLSPTIYFAPEARMGGIGNLSQILQGVDEVVRQKQISLRIAQAEGLAIVGGYDPRLVQAMAMTEKVLSYTVEDGRAKLLDRAPEGPTEFLLTDDGKESNQDDIRALARGQGNDVLTLTPEVAQRLGVSKGTVSSLDDLLFELGIGRNYTRIDQRSKQIMDAWKRSIENAKRQLRDLQREYAETEVNGATYEERTRQRGLQKRRLEEMMSILRRLGEGISPQWRGQNQIIPEEQIRTLLTQIDLQQAADRR